MQQKTNVLPIFYNGGQILEYQIGCQLNGSFWYDAYPEAITLILLKFKNLE